MQRFTTKKTTPELFVFANSWIVKSESHYQHAYLETENEASLFL